MSRLWCIRVIFLTLAVFQVALSASFANKRLKRSLEEACRQSPNSGMCPARFIYFYYNETADTCNKFVYGGCGGNDNNFGTGEKCVETCGGTIVESDSEHAPMFPPPMTDFEFPSDDACSAQPETGPCRGFFTRYYFDGEKCTEFTYGGCQGNSNNYETQEDCLKRCVNSEEETAS